MLSTHGARSVVWDAKAAAQATALQRWAAHTELRRGRNVAAVAVANKLARIAWAVWVQQRPFAAEHRPGSSRIRLSLTRRTAPSASHHGAPVGPARGYADNSAGRERSCKRLAPRARISMMARSRHGSTNEAEDTTAVRLFVQPSGFGEQPRRSAASRPCGRLRRCAPRSLDSCSRRGLSTAMRRRRCLRRPRQREGWPERFTRRFLLDGGVQIPC
jgi:hypothetical protein